MSQDKQQSVISWARLKHFPPIVWIVLASSFFVRGTFFAVWPFVGVILYKKFDLSATEIGLILTITTVLTTLIGFWVGNLSDRFGREKILLLATLIGVAAFTIIALAESLIVFIACIFLATLPKALWDSPSKAITADALPDSKTRELSLQCSYFAVNAGAAIGPLFGIWAGLLGHQQGFYLTAIAYLGIFLALVFVFKSKKMAKTQQQLSEYSFRQTLRILATDHLFLMLTTANIVMAFIYSQIDSSLIQYLTRAEAPDLAQLIASMIVLNATTIVILQFPLLKLMENIAVNNRIKIGLLLLAVSQLWFAYNPVQFYYGWLIAMFILSVGEAIMFPNVNIQIDQLAPAHLRGSYFGAANLLTIGHALAPFVGGVILDKFDGTMLFEVMFALTLITYLMYVISKNLKRPDFAKPSVQSD